MKVRGSKLGRALFHLIDSGFRELSIPVGDYRIETIASAEEALQIREGDEATRPFALGEHISSEIFRMVEKLNVALNSSVASDLSNRMSFYIDSLIERQLRNANTSKVTEIISTDLHYVYLCCLVSGFESGGHVEGLPIAMMSSYASGKFPCSVDVEKGNIISREFIVIKK